MPSKEELHRFTVGNIRWLTINGNPEFLDPVIRSLEEGSQLLRTLPNRRVLSTRGHPQVIVKHFRIRGMVALFKYMARGSPATREWNALRWAARHGLPVPKAIAVGRQKKFLQRDSYLVIEALVNAVPLGAYLYGSERAATGLRRKIIEEAARQLRKAHDAGMFHNDLHLDNLMIRNLRTAPEVVLIDLQRVTVSSSISASARMVNLAELHGGCTEATRAERLRFLRSYISGLFELEDGLRPLLLRLDKMGLNHRFHLWRSRQKRYFAENREFLKFHSGLYRGYARRAWREGTFSSEAFVPSKILSSCRIVKSSRTTTVGTVTLHGEDIFLKRYNYQGIIYAVKSLFRASRAKRDWGAANSCVMRNIPVALPLAYCERRRFCVLLESYLYTTSVEGDNLSQSLARCGSDFRRKRDLIRGLAAYIRRIHDRGASHRDLKSSNIMVRRDGLDRFQFFLVDFDGCSFGTVSRRRRIRDLSRVGRDFVENPAVTGTDCLRFLKMYLGPAAESRWKSMWLRIKSNVLDRTPNRKKIFFQ